MTTVPESNVYARSLVWRMFREAGDEDYLVARWSARAKLPFQFHWSAQQSLEKYLKGILLMNGKSVKRFGHNLPDLFAETTKIVGNLVPSILCPPSYFPHGSTLRFHEFEATESFVSRFNDMGDPGNRYRHYSLTFHGGDLHHYDELCFRLRRLMFPLEMPFAGTDKTWREVLARDPNYQPHNDFPFLKQKRGEELEECEKTLKWRNFSYFEGEAIENRKINSGIFISNSQVSMNIERGEEGKNAIEWLIGNATFSKSDLTQLHEILKKH